MSAECYICGEHVIECHCRAFRSIASLPDDGEIVLCIKKYMDNYGWTDAKYCIDHGFRNAFGEFRWNNGGKVTHWMRLPKIQEDV